MTTYTMTYTRGTILEAILCRRWDKKDVYGCQSFFLLDGGGLPEQEKILHLLTVPWERYV